MESTSDLELGKTYTLHHESQEILYGYVDKISTNDEKHVLLLSRLPQRRLLEHIDLDKVESYWMTTQDVTGSIQPSLEQVEDLLVKRVENHTGIAIVEGIEWLISLFGFSKVLNLIMRLKDSLHRKPWSILFVVSEGIFDEIEFSKWHRESPKWEIPHISFNEKTVIEAPSNTIAESKEEDIVIEESNRSLSFLVRIPRQGYTKEIARRRILQWRRMGLDVSSAEPALFQESDDSSYEIYKAVEEKVRRAIELDNRLDILEDLGWRSEVTKMRFRVRQLTGFDEVESRINELI